MKRYKQFCEALDMLNEASLGSKYDNTNYVISKGKKVTVTRELVKNIPLVKDVSLLAFKYVEKPDLQRKSADDFFKSLPKPGANTGVFEVVYDGADTGYNITLNSSGMTHEKGATAGRSSSSQDVPLGESYAALCATAYAMNPSTKFSDKDLKAAYDRGDYSNKFDKIIGVGSSWRKSGHNSAKAIADLFSTKSIAGAHDAGIMEVVDAEFKRLNKVERVFPNINKWTPADIWMYDTSAKSDIIRQVKSSVDLISLNAVIETLCTQRKLFGVSLKQTTKPVSKATPFNTEGAIIPVISDITETYGKRGFFKSIDVFIFYNYSDMPQSIQFRNFGTWQGEITITGSAAKHGKVGQGSINKILNSNQCPTIEDTIKSGSAKFVKDKQSFYLEFYNTAKKSPEVSGMDYETFVSTLESSPLYNGSGKLSDSEIGIRLTSKLLGCQFLEQYKAFSSEVIKDLVGYASSSTKQSAAFFKVGG